MQVPLTPLTVTRLFIENIIKQHCNVNCRSSSFVCRNINAWNSLPEHVVHCATAATFKRKLSTVDRTGL